MIKQDLNIELKDITLIGNQYISENPVGVLMIIHGMAEHRKRYDDFATFMANNGYITIIYDQRGHGDTAGSLENVGYMSDIDNFNVLVEDAKCVNDKIRELYPSLPIYLLGHSMGSFVSQRYIELYGKTINGVVLSGSNYVKGLLFSMGRTLAKLVVTFKGRKHKSKLLDKMSFGSYNKAFKPNRTQFDWLSENEENVDKYIADEYCGGLFTCSYFMDLLGGFKNIIKNFEIVPSELPIFIIAGSMDPVGNASKGPNKLYENYLKDGMNDVEKKLYEGKRHEILNESNKEEVYNDVLSWIQKHNK